MNVKAFENLPGYRFDPVTQRYRSKSTGRFVAFRQIYSVLNLNEEAKASTMQSLTEALFNGGLDAPHWFVAMVDQQRLLTVQQAALGAGGFENLRPADFIRIDEQLRDDTQRLLRFGRQIEAGLVSPGQAQVRVDMYVGRARTQFYLSQPPPLLRRGEMAIERRLLSPAEHCEWCLYLVDLGWQPYGTLPAPGESSAVWQNGQCLTNCKCGLERRILPIAEAKLLLSSRRFDPSATKTRQTFSPFATQADRFSDDDYLQMAVDAARTKDYEIAGLTINGYGSERYTSTGGEGATVNVGKLLDILAQFHEQGIVQAAHLIHTHPRPQDAGDYEPFGVMQDLAVFVDAAQKKGLRRMTIVDAQGRIQDFQGVPKIDPAQGVIDRYNILYERLLARFVDNQGRQPKGDEQDRLLEIVNEKICSEMGIRYQVTPPVTSLVKGGPGSGFHGHAGRVGEVGGSAPAGTAPTQTAASGPALSDEPPFPTEAELVNGHWSKIDKETTAAGKWKVTTWDGRNWFVKQPSYYFSGEGFDEVKNEVAADLLGQTLGLPIVPVNSLAIVPDSPLAELVTSKGQPSLLVYPWVDKVRTYADRKATGDMDLNSISDDDLVRLSLFDFVIANYDRNQNNLLFDRDSNMTLIDHGLAFDDKVDLYTPFYWGNSPFAPVEPEMIDWLNTGIQQAKFKATGATRERIDFAERRFELLKSAYAKLDDSGADKVWGNLKIYLSYRGPVEPSTKGGPGSGFHGHAGRPGKRGGSAPAGSGTVSDFEKNIAEVEMSIVNRNSESAIAIDARGYPIYRVNGDKKSVEITPEMRDSLKGNIMTHNHPGGWDFAPSDEGRAGNSFSREDIQVACEAETVGARVVTPVYVYSLKPPARGWNENYWERTLGPVFDRTDKQVVRDFSREIGSGRMTVAQAMKRHFHEVWSRISVELGLEYKRVKHDYTDA